MAKGSTLSLVHALIRQTGEGKLDKSNVKKHFWAQEMVKNTRHPIFLLKVLNKIFQVWADGTMESKNTNLQ